jgi:hypothetical protein
MPSRLGLLAVLLSWAAVTGHVVYHDVWPRYFADAPPALQIDLADEATQQAPTKWTITRGGKKIGTLTTRMEYLAADDTFLFVNNYGRLTLDAGKGDGVLSVEVPRLVTTIRVTRTGELREQSMSGELRVLLGPIEIGHAAAEVEGRVVDGVLLGRCTVRYPIGAARPTIDRELDPVPVPAGQVLNPMMPLNRLRDITPGRRWVIREVDPLKDALAVLGQELAKGAKLNIALPQSASGAELIAEVQSGTEDYPLRVGQPVPCRVIVYRGERASARTWVSAADGRVMRQEATAGDETLRFDRDD